MSQEIIYTSAPQGLRPGSFGFCTVATTPGMTSTLAERLEAISGYRHVYSPGDVKEHLNPVVYSHLIFRVAGKPQHILSRVANAGFDYSQRTNKLAHHVVLDASELVSPGPAWVLAQPGFSETTWSGAPRLLPQGRACPRGESELRVCNAWQKATGDAGWAGVLAQQTLRGGKTAYLIFPEGMDVLPLLQEALALLPAARRWDVTFSTFFTRLPQGVECAWRCVLANSTEAIAAISKQEGLIIELGRTLGPAPESELVLAARTGKSSAPLPRTAAKSLSAPAVAPSYADEDDDDFLEVIAEDADEAELRLTPPAFKGKGKGIAKPSTRGGGPPKLDASTPRRGRLFLLIAVTTALLLLISAAIGTVVLRPDLILGKQEIPEDVAKALEAADLKERKEKEEKEQLEKLEEQKREEQAERDRQSQLKRENDEAEKKRLEEANQIKKLQEVAAAKLLEAKKQQEALEKQQKEESEAAAKKLKLLASTHINWPTPISIPPIEHVPLVTGMPNPRPAGVDLPLEEFGQIHRIALVGATEKEGKNSVFHIPNEEGNKGEWSLQHRRLGRDRQVAKIKINETGIHLDWTIENPKQIGADLWQLSACALLAQTSNDQQRLIPFSFQTDKSLQIGLAKVTKTVDLLLPVALSREFQVYGVDFRKVNEYWSLDPLPPTKPISLTCDIPLKVEKQIVSKIGIERAINSSQGNAFVLTWKMSHESGDFTVEELNAISESAKDCYVRKAKLEQQITDGETLLQESEKQLEEYEKQRTKESGVALTKDDLHTIAMKQGITFKKEELKRMSAEVGWIEEQYRKYHISDKVARVVADIQDKNEKWSGTLHCFIARTVTHNGKDLLIPLVQIGTPYSP